MGAEHLCLLILVGVFLFPEFEANRISEARVPLSDARGATTTGGEDICFFDYENQYQICYKEGTAPRFSPGEPGYGTQAYMGYFTSISLPDTQLGFVYGHSFTGKANTYLWFIDNGYIYSYSFDYCPQVWKTPATAQFSVYHAIVGLATGSTPTFTQLIHKNPFSQENPKLGKPGGAQVSCSVSKHSRSMAPDVETLLSDDSLESLYERGPSVTASNPKDGKCFYDDYFPYLEWSFTGGSGSEQFVASGGQIHQYYRGIVFNRNSNETSLAYGHSPRGARHVIFSANLPGRGLVTYQVEFDSMTNQLFNSGYLYAGSASTMSWNVAFQRAQFYPC